ncbi:unnamed protein product [Paramecium sonneborni]|uniref:Uncharacterized protein n=1 Tax=Paramecium sonneborni TaxID=65129 RepID=A0A8S1RRT1_9CILI|nr:unnamed protein product [Paramecium sonneborni]
MKNLLKQLHSQIGQNQYIYKYKVIIRRNHDIFLDTEKYEKVVNSSLVIEGYKIWGSSYSQIIAYNPWAFQVDTNDGEQFQKLFSRVWSSIRSLVKKLLINLLRENGEMKHQQKDLKK